MLKVTIIAITIAISLSWASDVCCVSLTSVEAPDYSNWCWAACIRCASLCYEHDYSMCVIAAKCCEGGDDYIIRPVDYGCDCCGDFDVCAMYYPNSAQHLKIHEDWSLNPDRHVQEPPDDLITLSELETHTNSHPAIAGFVVGHAVVIGSASASNNSITIMDPADGNIVAMSYTYMMQIYGGWLYTDKLQGFTFGPLLTTTTDSSWGAIKALYGYSYAAASSYVFSNVNNEMVWAQFEDESVDTYEILRSENDEDYFKTIGIQAGEDTTFVDTTTVPGNTYQYRVISAVGDTLYYTDEQHAALKEVVTLEFPVVGDQLWSCRNNMVFVNDILIHAHEAPGGEQILKKIDMSDVYNPDVLVEKQVANNYALKDMGIVHVNNKYLACLFYDFNDSNDYFGIYDINKGATLPCIAWVQIGTAGVYGINYLSIKDNMIYVCTANQGIYAFNLNNPDNPTVWGQYLAPSELGADRYNVVITGDYLNVWYFSNAYSTWVKAQLLPIINDVQHSVYFQEICSSISENPCYDGRDIQYYTFAPVKGDYFLGWYNDIPLEESGLTLFSASDPLSPQPLKTFERNDIVYPQWSDFDDQYCFRCGDGSTYERDIRAHDMFDQEVLPPMPEKHQTGELVAIGSFPRWSWEQQEYIYVDAPEYVRWAAGLISYGKYLFYSDYVDWEPSMDEQNVQTLRIFEKHRGCDPKALAATLSLEPIASTYELDQYMIINWAVDGCPMKIDIILRESGDTGAFYQTLASIDKFTDPYLAQGSIDWHVESIHEDIDNYSYQLLVRAWNLEGYSITGESYSFNIVEEFPVYKPGKRPVINAGNPGSDNSGNQYTLDKLQYSEANSDMYYIVLSPAPFVDEHITFTVSCPSGINLHLNSLTLHVIDNPQQLAMQKQDESDYERLLIETIRGCEDDIAFEGAGVLATKAFSETQPEDIGEKDNRGWIDALHKIEMLDGPVSGRTIIAADQKKSLEVELPPRDLDMYRSYVLGYSGYLEETDEPLGGDTPKTYALNAVFPNPFNPNTSIEFHVPYSSNIRMSIFDINGRLIRDLVNKHFEPGVYTITWDGINNSGNRVSSGVYFSAMVVNNSEKLTKKLILIR